jgi:hypothetical protein
MGAFARFESGDQHHNQRRFEQLIGNSSALESVLGYVERVAPTDATVLLQGETGTGKELIARAIHNISARCGRPYIKLNCAAIPFDLLESELFGHERGAFTGAIAQKIGRFELADKGTLFLDEVGDIPLALQAKLLRVLQEQEFERLGSTHTHQVDVRLVAATNRDLAEMVKKGERISNYAAAVARAPRRHSGPGTTFCRDLRPPDGQANRTRHSGNDVCVHFVRVAGKRPRAAEFHRAQRHLKRWDGPVSSPRRAKTFRRCGIAGSNNSARRGAGPHSEGSPANPLGGRRS